eukprot:XP_025013299.1 LOW QUALITY PROTEIN: AP2-like ethylene-responsive transcription factor At1g16060 [Ricinus communis]
MEMATGNCHANTGRRGLCLIEGEAMETKCIKRRRRDSSLALLSSNDQQQQQPHGDQNTTATAAGATATTVKRSSRFRGVSRHRWTGRYEAHLWDKGSWNPTQRKQRVVNFTGAYDEEESAARAYDLAALKYWGASTFTNFPVADYEKEIDMMKNVTKEEYLATLRRRSSGFSRGVSKYRGVARHHHNGRWEARIGRVFGNKYLYLGTYSTQEEAAHAYDIAAIEYRGINAVTNFDLSTYIRWLRPGSGPSTTEHSKSTLEPFPMPTLSNQINPAEKLIQLYHSNNNPYMVEDLNTPLKQETFGPISPCTKSSSPTALGLLLKSSMFKELVEKNLNPSDDEHEAKLVSEMGKNNEAGQIFYSGMNQSPYTYPANGDALSGLGIESKDDNILPLYNRRGQFL